MSKPIYQLEYAYHIQGEKGCSLDWALIAYVENFDSLYKYIERQALAALDQKHKVYIDTTEPEFRLTATDIPCTVQVKVTFEDGSGVGVFSFRVTPLQLLPAAPDLIVV